MAAHLNVLSPFLLVIVSRGRLSDSARVFTIINNCNETVWPGVSPGENFNGGGFVLRPNQSMVFTTPIGWSGRIWGRTGCRFEKTSLAEFTLASLDFYDVSLVDGFNLPMVVIPINGKGNCSIAGCDGDLKQDCPKELSVKTNGKTVACRSAYDVFNTDEYCCRGVFGNPITCKPTSYSKKFKAACPTVYSYPYDDPTSIFTCSGKDYVVSFCTSRNQPVCIYRRKKLVCSGSR
ncbi:hypothetical protein UlMin_034567 [Ulmus minor]